MRVAKSLIAVVLAISVLINVILVYKIRGKRALITVNGIPISRADMNTYMEQMYGPQYKANMVRRIIIDNEAKAKGVAPTDAEVQEEFDAKRELDWTYAQRLARAPWMADDAKADVKLAYEIEHLLTKDIPVTDEEVREEYAQNQALYDTPNKAKCSVAAVLNDTRTEDIRRMLADQGHPYSPQAITANFPRDVMFLGDNKQFTFAQPYNTTVNQQIFSMEPKSVRVDAAGELAQLGAKRLVIRLDQIIPGHKAELSDPKTLKKIRLRVALHRAKPPNELISALWASANIVFDDPNDKANTEMILFPERAKGQ